MVHQAESHQQQAGVPCQRLGRASLEWVLFWACWGALVGLFAVCVALEVTVWRYADRIYPNVHVLGVNLGGLTTDEASERLAEVFSHADAGQLTVSDGQQEWSVPWQQVGLRLDADATARNAFDVGRADHGLRTLLRMRREPQFLGPVLILDAAIVRGVLEQLAPEVYGPPTDASLRLEGDQLVATSSQPGRALDVEAALGQVMTAFGGLGTDSHIALPFQPVPPQIADATAAQAQAEEMLNRQITISAYDTAANESLAWTVRRETIATWLRVERAQDGGSVEVRVAEEAIRATMAGLAEELGEGRGLRPEEATAQVLNAFEAGGGEVQIYLTHAPRTYTVQPGDTLTTIAERFGMPSGLIVEANARTDLSQLHIGQRLHIPSQDVLTPHMPVTGKRIVISIAEQSMRVYEDNALLHEWPVSTGIESSPTITGTFQILSKEERAFAQQWDLWMPHFMAIYRVGGETTNGIHGLPTLSSGQRLWEGALGSPASFGCIVLGLQEAETLYRWADIGVVVIIE